MDQSKQPIQWPPTKDSYAKQEPENQRSDGMPNSITIPNWLHAGAAYEEHVPIHMQVEYSEDGAEAPRQLDKGEYSCEYNPTVAMRTKPEATDKEYEDYETPKMYHPEPPKGGQSPKY